MQLEEIRNIGSLPCLEKLNLSSNPMCIIPDYRTKVLAQFGDRAAEVRHQHHLSVSFRDTQPVATCFSLCAVTVVPSSNISNAKVNDQHHKHCFSLLVAASAANAGTANITTATNIENGHTNTTVISCYTCLI